MSFVYPKYVWVPYEVCQDLSSAKIPQSGLESCVVGLPTPRWTGSGQNWVCLSQLDLNIDVVCLFLFEAGLRPFEVASRHYSDE